MSLQTFKGCNDVEEELHINNMNILMVRGLQLHVVKQVIYLYNIHLLDYEYLDSLMMKVKNMNLTWKMNYSNYDDDQNC